MNPLEPSFSYSGQGHAAPHDPARPEPARTGPPRTPREEEWERMIARMAQADEAALGSLYDETSPFVHGLALRIVGDAGLAEEVTADVFLQAWRQAGRYECGRGAPSTWLLTLTRSRAIDALRQRAQARQREQPLPDQLLAPDGRPDPLETSATAERGRLVRAALAQIGPDQRRAIELAYFGGLSHSEIAARLGEPLGTVKTRIRLGMLKLAQLLRHLEVEA